MGLRQAILDGKMMEVDRERAAAQGRAEGRSEGRSEGRAEEARKFVRVLLRRRYPELESLAAIDAISNVDALEAVVESVLDAPGTDAVRRAILSAAQAD